MLTIFSTDFNIILWVNTHLTRFYKNKIEQSPGWNDNILAWCLEAAREQNLKESDYWGGFVIDEMKIQVRLYFVGDMDFTSNSIPLETSTCVCLDSTYIVKRSLMMMLI